MAAIVVLLPLCYIPWNGYYKIGDTKYYLFRNISLVCMGCCVIVGLASAAAELWARAKLRYKGHIHGDKPEKMQENRRKKLHGIVKTSVDRYRENAVQTAVYAYGICAVLSAICSPYGSTAWTGEREWYMGAVTICLMVSGFWMAAHYGEQCREIVLLGEAAFTAVTLIGLFQKLGYDPLGLLKGYVVGDWEYTHMLSTLGNNNWLSGYYSVMFPLSLALLQKAMSDRKMIPQIILGICNVLAVMLLLLQGSDSGVLVACISVWLWLWLNRDQQQNWQKILLMLASAFVGMFIFGKILQRLGTYDILLQDGIAKKLAAWWGWPLAVGICLLFCAVCRLIPDKTEKMLQKGILYGIFGIAIIALLWYVYHLTEINFAEWGNRRGRLWQMAWTGFREGNLRLKLLGAGPDCFAKYLGELLPGGTVLFDKGYFCGSVFTNAHNEWLTTLVNLGLMGTAAYAMIFITALRTYRKNTLAVLLLFIYGIHSLISFQQVLNAPFFFLVLGLCEAQNRREKTQNR